EGREHGVEGRRITAAQPVGPCPFVGIHGDRTHHGAQRDTPKRAQLRVHICRHARAAAAFASQEVTMLGMMRSGGYNMWVLAAIGLVMLWTAIQFSRSADPHRLRV